MAIEGLEYNTNEWDGLGKGKKVAVPSKAVQTTPKTTPAAARNGGTVVVNRPKPVAAKTAAKGPDVLMTTINGIIARFRELFAWK